MLFDEVLPYLEARYHLEEKVVGVLDGTELLKPLLEEAEDRGDDPRQSPFLGDMCRKLTEEFPFKLPFPLTWVEYEVPDMDREKGPVGTFSRYGAMVFNAHDLPSLTGAVKNELGIWGDDGVVETLKMAKAVSFSLFVEKRVALLLGRKQYLGTAVSSINPDGTLQAFDGGSASWLSEDWKSSVLPGMVDLIQSQSRLIHGNSLLILSLLNAKGTEVAKDTLPRSVTRELKKRTGKVPTVVYRQLTLRMMKPKTKVPAAGEIDSDSPKNRLHWVRGHFAVYSEDRPLFGKYTGTFWVPAHSRGSIGAGQVNKTYKVKP